MTLTRHARALKSAVLMGAVGIALAIAPAVHAGPAAYTTVNEAVDGTGHCHNGNPQVNCNQYDGKQYVWLNGGPATASLPTGDYFFAVLDPGGQQSPNDGTSGNLSDDFDTYTNRTFHSSGGTYTYTGTHDFTSSANLIRLYPYADTTNNGGVYILAICSLASGYPVVPSDCKYDAFKVMKPTAAAFGIHISTTGSSHVLTWRSATHGVGYNVFAGKQKLNRRLVVSTTFQYRFATRHSLTGLHIVPVL